MLVFKFTSDIHPVTLSQLPSLDPKTLHVFPQYHVVFDDKFSTVSYTKNGEIPPYWLDLVDNSSESSTYTNVDLTNTWAVDVSDCGGDQIDPKLVLTRSFPSSKPPLTKLVSYEEYPTNIPDSNIDVPSLSPPSVELPVELPHPTIKET